MFIKNTIKSEKATHKKEQRYLYHVQTKKGSISKI